MTVRTNAVVKLFHQRQYKSLKAFCSTRADSFKNALPLAAQLAQPQGQIYRSLYASTQELLKLTPVLEQLFFGRWELALVGDLPLVSGNQQTHPMISIDCFAYDLHFQEPQTYAKFFAMPNPGIFRVLPYLAYHHPLNTIQNRQDNF